MPVPSGSRVAAVGSAVSGGKADALVYDPSGWTVQRTVALPFDAKLAAGGPDGLCSAAIATDSPKATAFPLPGRILDAG